MRRGLVFLNVFFLVPWVTQAQEGIYGGIVARWTNMGTHEDIWSAAQRNGLVRPDGTVMRSEPAGPAAGPMAISFRHYVHRPAKQARERFSRALKAAGKQRDGEALDQLGEAVRLDPEFFEAHLQIGLIWLGADGPDQALPALEQALAIDPSSQLAQALSAWALLKLGRFDQAELALRQAKQLGRALPIFDELLNLARSQRQAGRSTPQGSIP